MTVDEQPPAPPKQSWTILIVSVAFALLILIGAAVYIGLDLRSARESVAARESAEAAPARPTPAATCPDGVKLTCVPGRTLPVTLERWLEASGISLLDDGTVERTATEFMPVGVPGGKLFARVSHDGNALYEVGCDLSADPGAEFGSDALQRLYSCAGSAVPANAPYTQPVLAWISRALTTRSDSRLNCTAVTMSARFTPGHYDIEVTPVTDSTSCGLD
ncbi:hypothetical protein ACQP2P_17095 [Dactylosporangium sp. CA-139114]|uniref:hypothetical protein n=1 Tax=Dactylosporangium sp. CA-139114 TaxID=3239931 RepID=UPI003D973846